MARWAACRDVAGGEGGGRCTGSMQAMHDDAGDDRGEGEALSEDIPFELVGQVAGAGAVAEAGNVERGSAARHVSTFSAIAGAGRDG